MTVSIFCLILCGGKTKANKHDAPKAEKSVHPVMVKTEETKAPESRVPQSCEVHTKSKRLPKSVQTSGNTRIPVQTTSGMKTNVKPSSSSNTREVVGERDNQRTWAMKLVNNSSVKQVYKEFANTLKGKKDMRSPDNPNNAKMRYANIPLMEATRIKLKNRPNDYIHANRVKVPNTSIEYICTQAPLKNTIEDFWWMVLQERSRFVIQLCQDYFPANTSGVETHGTIQIKNLGKGDSAGLPASIRITELQLKSITNVFKPLIVFHIYMLDWPDQLAPPKADDVVTLYQYLKKQQKDDKPIIVHCSAGVGRTPTFVGIDYACSLIANNPAQPMADVVKEMRTQREKSVQSATQYCFLHVCLLELFLRNKVIEKSEKLSAFKDDYAKVAEKFIRRNENKIVQ
ncbi:unnamed protein product, partial [Mesorhabditis belari]|uniref:Uncharacterized protein n=1 Tax=Mesorhabditis belari TaxID=2138241 RepID=A0AAF3JBB1_9BILA